MRAGSRETDSKQQGSSCHAPRDLHSRGSIRSGSRVDRLSVSFTKEEVEMASLSKPLKKGVSDAVGDPSPSGVRPRTLEPLTSAAKLGAKVGHCIIISPHPPALICLRVDTCERERRRHHSQSSAKQGSTSRPGALSTGRDAAYPHSPPGTYQKKRPAESFSSPRHGIPIRGRHTSRRGTNGKQAPRGSDLCKTPAHPCNRGARSRPLRFFISAYSFSRGKD